MGTRTFASLATSRTDESVGTLRRLTTRLSLAALVVLGVSACEGGSEVTAAANEDDPYGASLSADARLNRPGRVRDLRVASASESSLLLQFTEVEDGYGNPANYEVRFGRSSSWNGWRHASRVSSGSCAGEVAGTAVGASLSCSVTGLQMGVAYTFQVVAYRGSQAYAVYGLLSNETTGTTTTGGGATAYSIKGGDAQVGEVGTELPQPLELEVRGSTGAVLSGVTVSWSAQGGGTVSAATSTTDSQGRAQIRRTLGTSPGEYRTVASVAGLEPLVFSATAGAGAVTRVVVNPDTVTLAVGDTATLAATVEDRYGNPVNGGTTAWASSDTEVAVVTSEGVAEGLSSGLAGVTATVDGVTGGGMVSVEDPAASTPAALDVYAGNNQTGVVGDALGQPVVVEVKNAAGEALPGVQVTWEVVEGGGSVSQPTSSTGTQGRAGTSWTLGTTAGTNRVVARVQGLASVSFTAQGQAGPVASITVTPSTPTVQVGGIAQLTATLQDSYGNTAAGSPTWSSSSTSVATVTSSGAVTGVAAGSAQIRAQVGSVQGAADLTVTSTTAGTPGRVTDLRVTGNSTSSLTVAFTEVSDGAGQPARYQVRYAPTPIGWGWGSATPVAEGTCAGVVQGSQVGQTRSCTVAGLQAGRSYDVQLVAYRGTMGTATVVYGELSNAASGVTATASVPVATQVVALSGNNQTGVAGSALSSPLVVEVRDQNGATMSGVTVAWTVSGGGAVSSGSTSTDSQGRTQVTRTLGTVAGSQQATATVQNLTPVVFGHTATAGPVASVTVSPSTSEVTVGSTRAFTATLRDQHGNTAQGSITWSSSSTGVATVNGSGTATGVASGTAQIRATSGGVTGQGALTVSQTTTNPGTVSDLRVVSTTATSATLRFTEVNDGTGSPARYQIRFHPTPIGWGWGSATPVSSGSCAGVVQGVQIGAAFTCTVEGLTSGASIDFQMIAYRGTIGSATFGNLSNVATGQLGSGTGGDPGTGTGSVSITPSSGGTITALGGTLQLSASAVDGSGNPVSNPGITWSSSNTSVASVNSSGRVTAHAVGTAIISAAAACCGTEQVTVNVTQQVASVQVSPGSASLNLGANQQFSASARDANGNLIPDITFTWSSTNNSVANVTSTGMVGAVAAGSANIRATASGQMGQSSVSVTSETTGGSEGGGGSTAFRANEPAGYRTVRDTDWSAGNRWNWRDHSMSGAYGEVRSDGTGGVSAPHYFRTYYPAGFPGGYEAAVATAGISNPGMGGFYMAYSFRLSTTWNQAESSINGVKHVIPFVNGGVLADSRFFGWASFVNVPGRPEYRAGVTVDGWASGHPRRDLPWVNEEAAFFRKGEWVTIELHVVFNSGGPNTGRARVWTNGVLTQAADNQHFPATHLSIGQIAGTYGGGIGNVPNNQYYDIDRIYFSTP